MEKEKIEQRQLRVIGAKIVLLALTVIVVVLTLVTVIELGAGTIAAGSSSGLHCGDGWILLAPREKVKTQVVE